MTSKKVIAIVVIALHSDAVRAEEEFSTGDAGLDAAIDKSIDTARKKIIAEAGAVAVEQYADGVVKKYAPKLIRKAAGGPVGIFASTLLASKPAGEGSDVVPGHPQWNQFLNRRAESLGFNAVDMANEQGRNFQFAGELQDFEADYRREILRREKQLADQQGRQFYPDPFLLSEINELDRAADKARSGVPVISNETSELESRSETLTVPFSFLESQMQSSLAGQTTGLTSHIGDARSNQAASELQRILSTTPDGPFVASVQSPSGTSTGGFAGDEGLNIAGILNVFAFDSGNLQDGDRVRITVRDSQGVRLSQVFTLTFGGRTSRVSARRGLVNVTITALNEGTAPPNTGGLRLSGDVAGSRARNFELRTGQSGTLAVRVLGN